MRAGRTCFATARCGARSPGSKRSWRTARGSRGSPASRRTTPATTSPDSSPAARGRSPSSPACGFSSFRRRRGGSRSSWRSRRPMTPSSGWPPCAVRSPACSLRSCSTSPGCGSSSTTHTLRIPSAAATTAPTCWSRHRTAPRSSRRRSMRATMPCSPRTRRAASDCGSTASATPRRSTPSAFRTSSTSRSRSPGSPTSRPMRRARR